MDDDINWEAIASDWLGKYDRVVAKRDKLQADREGILEMLRWERERGDEARALLRVIGGRHIARELAGLETNPHPSHVRRINELLEAHDGNS